MLQNRKKRVLKNILSSPYLSFSSSILTLDLWPCELRILYSLWYYFDLVKKLLLCLVFLDFDVVIDSIPVVVVFTVSVGDRVHHVLACVGTPRVDIRLGQHHLLVPPTNWGLWDTIHLPFCSLIKKNLEVLNIIEVKFQNSAQYLLFKQ